MGTVHQNVLMEKTEFITDNEIYERVILEKIPSSKKFLWIATSDLKDLHVRKGKSFVPFLEILSDLISENVLIRLIHAKEPGPVFRKDFDRFPNLINGLERILCPRVHFKSVIIDGTFIYTGSANLTGAGMGAKSSSKRNFEAGIISGDRNLVNQVMQQFDSIWMGTHCKKCGRREFCADYEIFK
jgi:phosphatidylserine/phosphatidylglycerophosphate/cardiolipin synthase-like enzyme